MGTREVSFVSLNQLKWLGIPCEICEAVTVKTAKMAFFWNIAARGLVQMPADIAAFPSRVKDYPNFLPPNPEDRCSTLLLNAVKYLPNLTLTHPNRT